MSYQGLYNHVTMYTAHYPSLISNCTSRFFPGERYPSKITTEKGALIIISYYFQKIVAFFFIQVFSILKGLSVLRSVDG